jgi:hypothetical protein
MKKLLLLILAVLVIGGGWNYHRNAKLATEEDKTPRPYKNLSSEELDQLLSAYQQEHASLKQALEKIDVEADPMRAYAPSDLKAKVSGFDRAQGRAARWNDVRNQMLDREVEMERIQRERTQRGVQIDSGWMRTLRRIVTI